MSIGEKLRALDRYLQRLDALICFPCDNELRVQLLDLRDIFLLRQILHVVNVLEVIKLLEPVSNFLDGGLVLYDVLSSKKTRCDAQSLGRCVLVENDRSS